MMPGPQELLLILIIVVLIFGAKRIPEIMGGLGQGIKSFKKAMDGEDTTPPPQEQPRADVPPPPAASEISPAAALPSGPADKTGPSPK